MGKYSPPSSSVILYVTRLLVRIDGYMRFLQRHAVWANSGGATGPMTGSGPESLVRGLGATREALEIIGSTGARLRAAMDDRLFPILERWVNAAMKVCVGVACASCSWLLVFLGGERAKDIEQRT